MSQTLDKAMNQVSLEVEEEDSAIKSVPAVESASTTTPQRLPSATTLTQDGPSTVAVPALSQMPAHNTLDAYSRRSSLSVRRSPSTQSLASTSSAATGLRKKTSMSSIQGVGAKTPPRSPVPAGRRTSSGFHSKPPVVQYEQPPTPPPLTPGMVAKEYFGRDLAGLNDPSPPSPFPEVAVIFHDACYGHRFSRPKASKTSLSTIVERPERIRATVLGVSIAYVLLGGRHTGGGNAPHPKTQSGERPFIIRKSSRRIPLSFSSVTNVHGTGWMAELQEMCNSAEAKLTANGKELVRPTGLAGMDDGEKPKFHEGDLYLCAESLEAFEGALGGVFDAIDMAFEPTGPRRCFACVRPPGHHCSGDYPSGFCWLNNVHVGISYAASTHGLTHAAVFDFDLHHGDGSQSITWDRNAKVSTLPKNAPISKKTRIGYYSLHDINSYPCEWGDEEKVRDASLCIENAHGQNIWNVHLQPWKTNAEFWELYNERYSILLKKMRTFLRTEHERLHSLGHGQKSKAAIFISAGFDASEWEGHGMQRHAVNVPTDFYARVTRDIVDMSNEADLGVDGRVISVLEGGYSDRALMSGALSHVCGLASSSSSETAASLRVKPDIELPPTVSEPIQGLKGDQLPLPYDNEWWSPVRLDELENVGHPIQIGPATRKFKGPAPTYQTPTQSFMTKVVSQPTYQRSISGSFSRSSPGPLARPPTPPPPEVDWTIASLELCQLLIPQDRTTRSCKPEDLNAKATEARRNRHSLIGTVPELPVEEMQKMQLRDKAAKASDNEKEDPRPTSRASAARRRTIGGVELAAKQPTRSSNRRVSVASSIISNPNDSPANSSAVPPDQLVEPKQRAPPKPRATKKAAVKPPVPRMPSSKSHTDALRQPEHVANDTPARLQGGVDAEMADLASSVKKMSIKLNVPTREEYEAREASKQAAAPEPKKATTTKAPRKPAVKKLAKEPTRTSKSKGQTPTTLPTSARPESVSVAAVSTVPEPIHQPPTQQTQPAELSQSIHQPSAQEATPTFAPQRSSFMDVVMAPPSFQPPDSAPIPATVTAPMPDFPNFPISGVDAPIPPKSPQLSSEPTPLATASTPASSLSSPRSAKNSSLPKFTAHGPIPFGPSPTGVMQQGQVTLDGNPEFAPEEEAEKGQTGDVVRNGVFDGHS